MKTRLNSLAPPPPPGYTNALIGEVVEDGVRKVAVHVPPGGGANAIYRTPFDQEPAGTVEGRGDFYDNADVISRQNDAGVWQTYGPIFALERPVAKLGAVTDVFTPVNQGTATTDVTHSGIHVMAPMNSGLHAWVVAVAFDSPPTGGTVDLSFQVSHDNHAEHWEELLKLANDDFLTEPDQVGFFANESSGLFNLRTTLLHWLMT